MSSFYSTSTFLTQGDRTLLLAKVLDNARNTQLRFFRAYKYMLVFFLAFWLCQFKAITGAQILGIDLSHLDQLCWILPLLFMFQQYTALTAFIKYNDFDKAILEIVKEIQKKEKTGPVPELLTTERANQRMLKRLLQPPSTLFFETSALTGTQTLFGRLFGWTLFVGMLLLTFAGYLSFLWPGWKTLNDGSCASTLIAVPVLLLSTFVVTRNFLLARALVELRNSST